MKNTTIFGLIAFLMLIGISCKNSTQPKESNNGITSYDSIEETNDWYRDADDNSLQLKSVRANGKMGFLYGDGEELFPCIFDSVVDVNNSGIMFVDGKKIILENSYFTYNYENSRYAKVLKDGKWGLVTMDGKIAIPCVYDEIYDFDYTKTSRMEGPYIDFWDSEGKTAVVKKNGKWGLVDTKGDVLADYIYEDFFIPDVKLFYGNRAAAKKNGLWGFLNEKGNPVTSFIYEEVSSSDLSNPQFISTFCEGMAVVKKNGKWGVIDKDGNGKIPFIYDYISNFCAESIIVQKDSRWGYINKKGIEVIPAIYDEIKWFERGICPVKKDGLWGFLSKQGEIVVSMMYDDILVFDEVAVDGGLWFFSQDAYCAVKQNGKWGLVDKDINIIVNFEYDSIKFTSSGLDDWRYFSDEGFLSVQKGKFWNVVNKDGINHIPFEYDDVEIWSEGNVCVKKNGKWGLLDSLGKQLVPIEHKYAMDAGNYIYKNNNK